MGRQSTPPSQTPGPCSQSGICPATMGAASSGQGLDRLVQGSRERFPRYRWRMSRGRLRRLGGTALAAIKRHHGIRLPEDFAAFATSIDHGGFGPGYGLLGTGEWAAVVDPGSAPVMPCPLSLAPSEPPPVTTDPAAGSWLAGTLPLVSYSCAYETRLVVTGEHRGRLE